MQLSQLSLRFYHSAEMKAPYFHTICGLRQTVQQLCSLLMF